MPDNDHNTVITELSDVQVETLGLVTQGANREEFFLLKSDTDTTDVTESITAAPEANLWTRFLKLFQKTVDTEMAELAKAEAEVAPVTESVAEITPEPEPVVASEIISEVTPAETVVEAKQLEKVSESVESLTTSEPESEASEPQTSNLEATMEDTVEKAALESRLTELEKANAALVAEVEKAREERDRETYIAKANSFAAIPVAPVELGEQLHALAKWDAKRLSFWTDLLKSIDALAADAELFIEKGTAFTPEQPDVLAVIAKSDDPKAEILKLSKKDAEAYLRSVRSRAKSAQEG